MRSQQYMAYALCIFARQDQLTFDKLLSLVGVWGSRALGAATIIPKVMCNASGSLTLVLGLYRACHAQE